MHIFRTNTYIHVHYRNRTNVYYIGLLYKRVFVFGLFRLEAQSERNVVSFYFYAF